MSDSTQTVKARFRVEGMDCASCAAKIENALQRMPGVTDAAASVTGGMVTVRHDYGGVDDVKIRNQISDLGYWVVQSESEQNDPHSGGKGTSAAGSESRSGVPDRAWRRSPWSRKG